MDHVNKYLSRLFYKTENGTGPTQQQHISQGRQTVRKI